MSPITVSTDAFISSFVVDSDLHACLLFGDTKGVSHLRLDQHVCYNLNIHGSAKEAIRSQFEFKNHDMVVFLDRELERDVNDLLFVCLVSIPVLLLLPNYRTVSNIVTVLGLVLTDIRYSDTKTIVSVKGNVSNQVVEFVINERLDDSTTIRGVMSHVLRDLNLSQSDKNINAFDESANTDQLLKLFNCIHPANKDECLDLLETIITTVI